jgi:NADPH2 dehydrogenase
MVKLQDSITIRGNIIKNRIVMEPLYTFSFRGDNGSFYGKQHLEHYTRCAKGGVGLLIVQGTDVLGAVTSTEKWSEENTGVLKQIAENCHEYGVTVLLQLACKEQDINEMSVTEITKMQQDMMQAAVTADELGFNGVEFHFAHGFTLCKFLDASYNRRTDQYGGDIDNRARILTDIIPEIRKNTQDKFMLSVRMGESQPESRDGIEAAKTFEKAGVNLLNISFGMKPPILDVPEGFPCSKMTFSAGIIKREVNIPVIAVNQIRTEAQAQYLLKNGYADFIGIGRGILADTEFANHMLNGEPINKCHGCKRCLWFTDHTKCPARKSDMKD